MRRPPVSPSLLSFLRRELAGGRMILFTGAGFSSLARDREGHRRVPTGEALTDEIWRLAFPDDERDGSSLQDLFQHALLRHRDELAQLLDRRLRVAANRLPDFYQLWFEMPWRRIYTVNVDDLEQAAARRFQLRRHIRSLSALREDASDELLRVDGETLDVIHLNGSIEDGPEHITFSTMQYAERLAERCAFYSQLIRDFAAFPMLFVGTKLDESPLWQALEMSPVSDRLHTTPPGLLVTQNVTRARQSLLASLNINWLQMDVRAFAEDVLVPLLDVVPQGLEALARTRVAEPVETATQEARGDLDGR